MHVTNKLNLLEMDAIDPLVIDIPGADAGLPSLVVITSFSLDSSLATTNVVENNYNRIPDLVTKYRKIVIIRRYPSYFKKRATDAFNAAVEQGNPELEDITYSELAEEVITCLMSLGLGRIHLMGKCAGASLVQFIVQSCDAPTPVLVRGDQTVSIEKLIPCVPACRAPEGLLPYMIPMLFAWQRGDTRQFTWGVCCKDEQRYSGIFTNGDLHELYGSPGTDHEVPVKVFCLL